MTTCCNKCRVKNVAYGVFDRRYEIDSCNDVRCSCHTTPTLSSLSELIKEFEQAFENDTICCGGDFHRGMPPHLKLEEVKSFIQARFSSMLSQIREEMTGKQVDPDASLWGSHVESLKGFNSGLETADKIISKMME